MDEEIKIVFLAALADVLEVADIAEDEDFRRTPLWGSLTCFALKVMIAQRFGKDLSVAEIAETDSAGALMERTFS